jgi:5-methylcytosine-specific restriction enzyme B
MSRAWFFQANPKLYDIDGALAGLDHIWWRVPQYASQLRVGDVALIWRSGADAGVVRVGRVTTEPQLRSAPDPGVRQHQLVRQW